MDMNLQLIMVFAMMSMNAFKVATTATKMQIVLIMMVVLDVCANVVTEAMDEIVQTKMNAKKILHNVSSMHIA